MKTKVRHTGLRVIVFLLCLALAWGAWSWYDTNVDRSGWKETRDGMGYRDFHGRFVTGWQEIDGNYYHFGFDKNLNTHWLEIDGVDYYLGEDGIRVTGWQEIGGERYYFDENGVMLSGWQDIDGVHCLLRDDGPLVTGWMEDEKGKRYFSQQGTISTGFLQLEEDTYYFDEEGYLCLGLQEIDEKTYHFAEDGTMSTGWVTMGEYDYYFLEDGTMVNTTQVIDGQTFHFAPGGQHVVLVNPWNYLPENLELNLVTLESGQQVDESCYDALMEMFAACEAEGYFPYVCSGYRTQEKQESLMENQIKTLMREGYNRAEAEAKAKTSVAIPGTSEHQLGLAVDIISDERVVLDAGQASTATQQWLMKNCWDYGFILRYPNGSTGITGIIFEPWHYRYVGKEIALEIKELGITLEEYLDAVEPVG